MSQDSGPESDITYDVDDTAGETVTRKRRSSGWPWLALAILLLLVIWLIWQYIGTAATGPDRKITTTTSDIELTPNPGTSAIPPEETASDDASETVADGPAVPDVVGMDRSAALAALQAAGYVGSVTDVYGTTHPSGSVISQNPSAGAALGEGETVGLIVQLQPESKPTATVPDLAGMQRTDAENELRGRGLVPVITYYPDAAKAGIVVSQWPGSGEVVEQGGDVQIQVAIAP